MIGQMPNLVGPGAFANGPEGELAELTRQIKSQRRAQQVIEHRMSRSMEERLTLHRMEAAAYQADRALANAACQRLMSQLAGKFSLISKIQQNLG